MEQEPGHDPEHDGPADPQPGEGSPGPDDADADASDSGASSYRRCRFRDRWRKRERFRPVGCAGGHARGGEGAGGAAVRVRPRRRLGQAPAGPGARRALARAVGPDWRCASATGEELIGLLRAMAAQQSWAGAGMLGIVRALIRDDDQPYLGRPRHGDLPDEWDDSLVHEIALALAVSVPSADKTTRAAWELARPAARGRAAAAGRHPRRGAGPAGHRGLRGAVGRELRPGRGAAAAGADGPAAQDLHPGRADRDRDRGGGRPGPGGAAAEVGGEAPVAGDDVPRAGPARPGCRAGTCRSTRPWRPTPISTLALSSTRTAGRSRASGSTGCGRRPTWTSSTASRPMIGSPAAISALTPPLTTGSQGRSPADQRPRRAAAPDGDGLAPAPVRGGSDCPCGECDGRGAPPDDDCPMRRARRQLRAPGRQRLPRRRTNRPDGGPGHDGPSGARPPTRPRRHRDRRSRRPARRPPPTLTDLILPLATLLGHAERPGEGHALGTLDPALTRALAATATLSPHTTVCVTVTDADGIAIGHGCAKVGPPGRLARPPGGTAPAAGRAPGPDQPHHHHRPPDATTRATAGQQPSGPKGSAGRSPDTARTRPPGAPRARGTTVARRPQRPPGDPDWCGPWALTLPSGQEYSVNLAPVPTYDCDHRNESHAYKPNATLRHLVQIRDHSCTFPPCSRHARDSDFEHGAP